MSAAWRRHEDERLSALLDDELDDGEALEVARHLARCRWCRRELEELRAARDLLRALRTPPTDAGTARSRPPHVRAGGSTAVRWAAVVTAGVLGAAAVGALAGGDGTARTPAHPVVDPVFVPGGPRPLEATLIGDDR